MGIVETADRLSKSAHFLPVRANITKEQLTQKYANEIVRFHGIIASIMLNRNSQSKSQVLKSLQQAMGTQSSFSNGYHPQTNSKTERTNQTIEDKSKVSALDVKRSWDEQLPLMEFAYNKSYHSIIHMALFKALYGKSWRSLFVGKMGERRLLGPDWV